MMPSLERLERHHEALIAALDANDVAAIDAASRDLATALEDLKGVDSWVAQPELKLAAERIGRLAEAATMRVNLLNDHAKRRAQNLAAARGQSAPLVYGR